MSFLALHASIAGFIMRLPATTAIGGGLATCGHLSGKGQRMQLGGG